MRAYEDEIEKSIIRIVYERKQKAEKGFDQSKQTKEGRHRTCKCQKHEISSGELKRELEHQYRNGRKMSWTLVSSRLNQMVGSNSRKSRYLVNPILIKRDLKSNTCYSLTSDAETRYRLKVSFFKGEAIREIACQLLLIYASYPSLVISNSDGHDVPVRNKFLDSESEFDEFLYKIHIRKENLVSSYSGKVESKEIIKLTPKERQEDIQIFKTDVDGGGGGGSIYSYALPGISIDEVLTYIHSYQSPFSFLRSTDEELKECFELLEGGGLLKRIRSPILEYLDETERYEIASESLEEFLHYSLVIRGLALYRMISTWSCRKPTDEEKVWYALHEGREGAEDSFRKLNDERKKLKENPKKKEMEEQRILNDDKAILKACAIFEGLYSEVIRRYSFIADVLVEWSYPTFLIELQKGHLI